MKTTLSFLLLVLTLSTPSFAQENTQEQAQATLGVNILVANPQGPFENATNNENMFGLDIHGVYHIGMLGLGAGFSFISRGSEEYKRALSTTVPTNVDVTTSNDMFQLYLLGRLQYPTGWVQPYVEGTLGGSFFSTTTKLKSRNPNNNDDDIASDTNQSDFTWAMSYGAGIMFKVWEGDMEGYQGRVLVDLKVKNSFGGEAEYLQGKDDIVYNAQKLQWEYNASKSKTDFLGWHLGVAVQF